MTLYIITALIGLTLTLCEAVILIYGMMKMKHLGTVEPFNQPDPPLVSIIVPACNEERTIAAAVQSLLAQEYPNLEIIVIDDRSTDNTHEIVSALLSQSSRLAVHQIRELPSGWLGKSHALQYGAKIASGDYLLFTDADIHMEKSTVARSVAYMMKHSVDHLALFFKNISSGWLLDSLILDGGAGLLLLFKPWKVDNPRSKSFVGVGAFNMVRSDVYGRVGGHSSIRMHPIDDLMLGKIIKRAGLRQHCLFGMDFVSVRWYESVPAMMNGLMKNLFALFHYRVWLVVCALLLSIVAHVLPLWGALFSTGSARILFAGAVCIRLLSFVRARQIFHVSFWCIPGSLVSPYLNIIALIRSTWVTIREGGISWRSTFYPLPELRKSEPIFFKYRFFNKD